MHKELRYQVKTHAISDMPRKGKDPAIAPFFLRDNCTVGPCGMP
jgi:hypothetical protein